MIGSEPLNTISKFFKSLRWKLILTYTLVTVLALLALEVILFVGGVVYTGLANPSRSQYIDDVISMTVPEARAYLQPEQDLSGLQIWLDVLRKKGYASLDAQDWYDSPAAKIVDGSTLYVLSPDRTVLAQSPRNSDGSMVADYEPYSLRVLQKALKGAQDADNLYAIDESGNYYLAIPIYQKEHNQPVLGVLVLTIAPLPQKNAVDILGILGLMALAGLLMLVLMAPFGAIFGFILSTGLTRRLKNLASVADSWGSGDFSVMPAGDRSEDEIGILSYRMRSMAERIQNLMQDTQALGKVKERNRIAQELHDTVKQQNFATLMQVRAARNMILKDPDAAEKSLLEAENLIKSSQQELGLMIAELRPPVLDGKGLSEALKEYLQVWSGNACIPSNIVVTGEQPLPMETEQILYRVAQEALSNVARHSRASAVTVRLNMDADKVLMEIVDNGVGFDPQETGKTGFGMVSMHDRVAEVGGRIKFKSRASEGTHVVVEIPLKNEKGII
jgi:NarL family two-component system sensor histidine kinase LiaS